MLENKLGFECWVLSSNHYDRDSTFSLYAVVKKCIELNHKPNELASNYIATSCDTFKQLEIKGEFKFPLLLQTVIIVSGFLPPLLQQVLDLFVVRDTNLRTLTTEDLTDLVQTVKDSKAAADERSGEASASSSQTGPWDPS